MNLFPLIVHFNVDYTHFRSQLSAYESKFKLYSSKNKSTSQVNDIQFFLLFYNFNLY